MWTFVKILVYSALLHKSPGSLQTLGTEVVEAPSHATMSSTAETSVLRSLLGDINKAQGQTPEPTPSPTQSEQDDSVIAIYLGSFAGIGCFAYGVWEYCEWRKRQAERQQETNTAFADEGAADEDLSALAEPSLSVVVESITRSRSNSEVRIVPVDTDESWTSSRGEDEAVIVFHVEKEGELAPLTELSEKMVKSVLENIGLPSDETDDSSSGSLTCVRSISDEVVGGFVDQFCAPEGPRVFGIHVVLESNPDAEPGTQLSGSSRTATDDHQVLTILELQAGVPDLPSTTTASDVPTTTSGYSDATSSDAELTPVTPVNEV